MHQRILFSRKPVLHIRMRISLPDLTSQRNTVSDLGHFFPTSLFAATSPYIGWICSTIPGCLRMTYSLIALLTSLSACTYSGGNNGSVLVHDFQDGGTFYGLGAINNGAVRCIETTDSKLVCAGDDGTLITYCY